MTSLTIELTPEIYARLQREARRRGTAAQVIIQELLDQQLIPSEQVGAPELAPDVRLLLATMSDADMIVPPQGTSDDAIRLLQSWNEADQQDDDDEGEGSWDDVLRAIDADRPSSRKLFADVDQQS